MTRPTLVVALVAVLALAVAPAAAAASSSTLHRRAARQSSTLHRDRGTVRFFARHRWLLRGETRPVALRALRFARAEIAWTRRELRETEAALRPPTPRRTLAGSPSWLVSAFLCIHRYEGSWTDSGDPYWGGLQFGAAEWSTYGGRYAPTANLATPAEQIAAGIAYYRADGDSFAPWPNSSRACGLR